MKAIWENKESKKYMGEKKSSSHSGISTNKCRRNAIEGMWMAIITEMLDKCRYPYWMLRLVGGCLKRNPTLA
jgi:hypothetical protein